MIKNMATNSLPVILSFPHGAFGVPEEFASNLSITETDIYNECDLWIEELFDFKDAGPNALSPNHVLACVSTTISRAIVDVNREPDDLDNVDGPVKAQTSYGRPTCARPLTLEQKRELVQKYWQPFHDRLEAAIASHGPEARLFLDCHNMAQLGPSAYGDSGTARPLICLANLGKRDGSVRASRGPASCDAGYIRRAAELAEDVFSGITLLEPLPGPPPATVAINQPYPGGYILRRYAAMRGKQVLPPGLMIELNRGLYVGNQTAQAKAEPPNMDRISMLRERIHTWLTRLVEVE